MGHARAIATAPDPDELCREIVAKGLCEDNSHPPAAFKKMYLAELFDRRRDGRRRQGQVEDAGGCELSSKNPSDTISVRRVR